MSSLFSAYSIVKALRLPLEWASDQQHILTTSRVSLPALDKAMIRIEQAQAASSPQAIRARAEARREELRACLEGRRAHAAKLRQQAEQARRDARAKRAAERLLEQQSGQAQAFARLKDATMAKARQLRGMASNWAKHMMTQLQGGVLWAQTWLTHWNVEANRTQDAIPEGDLRELARELEARARWLDNGTSVLMAQFRGML